MNESAEGMDSPVSWDAVSPSRAVINHEAIRHNLRRLREYAPECLQLAVVKGDAYGHGILPVALTCLASGADYLGVAQLTEALALRQSLDAAGCSRDQAKIFSWIASPHFSWEAALEADIEVSVSWTWTLAQICAAARACGKVARIHVKVDTGMSRAGSTLADFPALATAVRMAVDEGLVEVAGTWSHLSRADERDDAGDASTARHVQIFEEALAILRDAGVNPGVRHLAATAGIVWHPQTHYDMVRPGIGLYGLTPNPQTATSEDLGLRPVMTVEASLIGVKVIDEGTPVSYGGTWTAPSRRWVGLVPLGYADGILRAASGRGEVTVRAERESLRAPVRGRVCMDQFVVDLGAAGGVDGEPSTRGGAAPAAVGDRVVLWGESAQGVPSADAWAQAADTINYEVVVRVGERVPRVHVGQQSISDL